MAEGVVQVSPDSTGKKIRTQEVTEGLNTVEQQVVTIANADGTLVDSTTVNVGNFPATQAVSAASLPLPTGAATAAKQPALGTAGTPSVDVISVQGIASGTAIPISGTVTTSPPANASTNVAQVGGAAVTLGQKTGANSIPVVLDSDTDRGQDLMANSLPVAIASDQTALPAPTLTKGTQGSTGYAVQNLKDAGRTYLSFVIDRIAGVASEALATMTINKGGTTSSASSYTVTTGKTLRLQLFVVSIADSTTTAVNGRVRVRSAATVSSSSPIVLAADVGSYPGTAAAGMGVGEEISIPDGLEIASGQQIGISHIISSTSSTVSVNLVGYEY